MKITFMCELDVPSGTRRRFNLTSDMPWPALPGVGDYVVPHATGRYQLQAREVLRRIFAPDGGVILAWSVDALGNDPEPQVEALLRVGYVEVEALQ